MTTIGIDTAMPAEVLRTLYQRWGFVAEDEIAWPGKTYRSIVMVREIPDVVAPLTGGNVTSVVRMGTTVRRAAGAWTPGVHALLDAWESAGITQAPRSFGLDDHGREIVSFLPGTVLSSADPRTLYSPRLLVEAGALLRRMHDASVGVVAEPYTWRVEHEPREVICHGDFAPYNLIVDGVELAGVIDADFAGPGPRLRDLAYLAYRLAPFAEDAEGYDPACDGTVSARLSLLSKAYGLEVSDDELRGEMIARLHELAAFSDNQAARTANESLEAHAAMYRRDAERLSNM